MAQNRIAAVYNAPMLFAAWIACTPGSVSLPIDDHEVTIEALAPPGTEGLATSGPAVIYAEGERWQWVDPRGSEIIEHGTGGLPIAAGESRGERFVLAGEVHVLLDHGAVGIGPDALADRDLLDLCGDGEQLWLTTSAGVVIWRGDVLAELTLDGAPARGPVACHGSYLGEPAVWVADGSDIHAITTRTNPFEPLVTEPLPGTIEAVAIDATGRPWAAAGGALFRRRDGHWQRVRLGSPVWNVLGGASAAGVWAITKAGPRFVPNGERPTALRPSGGPGIDTEPLGRWLADGAGRLLVRDEAGLHRLSVGRPLWLDGLRSGDMVAEPTWLELHPTLPQEVESITVRVPTAELELAVSGSSVLLDPGRLSGGRHNLEVVVSYVGGEQTRALRQFVTTGAAGAITWAQHIAPIHQDTCALCHDNAAETILDGPEAWEGRIDDILKQVRSGAMPLGRSPLATEQISVIEQWAEGGFVR